MSDNCNFLKNFLKNSICDDTRKKNQSIGSEIKCGEVYFQSDNEDFSIKCVLCKFNFGDLILFSNHFLTKHNHYWKPSNIKVEFENENIHIAGEEIKNNLININNKGEISYNIVSERATKNELLFEGQNFQKNVSKCDMDCENEKKQSNSNLENETDDSQKDDIRLRQNVTNFKELFCNICMKSFNNLTEFQGHQNKRCFKVCESYSTANEKVEPKLEIKSWELCDIHIKKCPKVKLKSKCKIKVLKENLTCETCGKQMPNISSLKRHQRCHLENSKRPFKCIECAKGFNTKVNLEQHRKVHYDPKVYECDFCFMKFNSKLLKNNHQKEHSIKYQELVGMIGKRQAVLQQTGIDNQEKLLLETNCNVPDGYWRCDVCDKMFKNSRKKEEHKRFHDEVKPFICEVCGKGMASAQMLNRHIIVHKEDRRFKCSKCGSAFFTAAHRNRHEQTTCNSEKRFQCGICKIRFNRKERLKSHSLTHEKNRIKNFKCQFCNASYLTANSLRVHKKKHMINSNGPYTCKECPAVFINKESVRRHERRHENRGAFKCEYCEKLFNDKEYLKQHTKRQHFEEIEPYACLVCKEQFYKKLDLKNHLANHVSS